MKKRILIPYCNYGVGHRTIGNYIKTYFEEQSPDYEIMTIDLLAYSIPIIGKVSQKTSEYLMQRQPFIWNTIYTMFDNKLISGVSNKISMTLFKNKKLQKAIVDFNPDLTISTHFFGSCLVANYNKKGYIKSKLITIITDYRSHEFWLQNKKGEDAIIVGHKDEKRILVKRGVEADKIKPWGIPIAPKLPINFDRERFLRENGLSGKKPICVFFGGGGNGTKAVLPYIKKVVKAELDIDFLFISGKNKYVKNKVEKMVKDYNADNIKVYGFVNNVPEMLQVCDFVITKPGGAQTTETMYFKKPAILINSHGGQENGNVEFFAKNGFGRYFHFAFTFMHFLHKINKNPSIIQEMKKKLQTDRKDAMENLYELSKKLLK